MMTSRVFQDEVNASKAISKAKTVGSVSQSNWASYWASAPSNVQSKTQTPQTTVVQAPSGAYINVTEADFARVLGVLKESTMENAWNALTLTAGIDALGVPTNWWPGLHAEDPYLGWWGSAGLHDPKTRDLAQPESWAAPAVDFPITDLDTGMTEEFWVRYDPGRAAQQYMLMGSKQRSKYATMMVNAGLLPKEWKGIGDFDPEAAAAFSTALSWANYWGKPVDTILAERGKLIAKLGRGGSGGRGSGAGPQVKLEVPNYETLLEEAKNLIQSKVGGRDVENWEMSLVADHMKQRYGEWADATKARMIGGNGTYEVPDPVALSEKFVENKYGDEISRLEDIGDQRTTNQLLIGAATRGTEMMGGLRG